VSFAALEEKNARRNHPGLEETLEAAPLASAPRRAQSASDRREARATAREERAGIASGRLWRARGVR
jgi:hypothetical protein